ncbi:MAG: hypothetical protein U0163_20900 [Gemmatimonadaceae bacterium]
MLKFLIGPHPYVFVVGGIGVGKTSFAKWFLTTVLPDLSKLKAYSSATPPLALYFSFTRETDARLTALLETFGGINGNRRTEAEILKLVGDIFSDHVLGAIERAHLFTLTQEVTDVWHHIVSAAPGESSSHLENWLSNKLHVMQADEEHFRASPDVAIERRKKIRRTIEESPTLRLEYAAHLLRYIKSTYHPTNPVGVCVVVDNIDRLRHNRDMVINLLRGFAQLAGVRFIIPARQSTFYQDVDDARADHIDAVPHDGVSPLEVVEERLSKWLDRRDSSLKALLDLGIGAGETASFVAGVDLLRRTTWQSPPFKAFMAAISGRSVRRGLALAKRMIANSILSPMDLAAARPRVRDVSSSAIGSQGRHISEEAIRGIMLGLESSYRNSPSNEIENVFDLKVDGKRYNLLKLRSLDVAREIHPHGTKSSPTMATTASTNSCS